MRKAENNSWRKRITIDSALLNGEHIQEGAVLGSVLLLSLPPLLQVRKVKAEFQAALCRYWAAER